MLVILYGQPSQFRFRQETPGLILWDPVVAAYPKDSNDVKIVNETAPALPTPAAPLAPAAPSSSSEAGQRALLETIQRNKAAALDARHISGWPQSAAYQQIATFWMDQQQQQVPLGCARCCCKMFDRKDP